MEDSPLQQIQSLLDKLRNQIRSSTLPNYELEHKILGQGSEFASLGKQIVNLQGSEKQQFGIAINAAKQELVTLIANKNSVIAKKAPLDASLPPHFPHIGHLHPTTMVIRQMNEIFAHMGFSVYDGPEIESDEFNYNRVNLPLDHPGRDLQDSLFIEEPEVVLRTHTSSVEARILEAVKQKKISLPFRYVIPGKVYRNENANVSNNIMFYQYEGMAVGQNITLSQLKGTLEQFVHAFFGKDRETRFRCKYYPQVEPGVGVDISCGFCNKKGCNVCKGRGYIEMLGAGMVHPNMLRVVDIDPAKFSGFAWGMGLDRLVMQRFGIEDIRSLYNGDIGYKE